MDLNQVSYHIRGAAFKVFNELGPGLFESVYETALAYELKLLGYEVKRQVVIPVLYADMEIESGFRADIIVNDAVIIELKSVEDILPLHYKQLLTYLRLSDLTLGFLINFNTETLDKNSLIRIVNNF
ncbi:MAG: GxxExxY protein [Tannerella sp.]|jgi:GxxExxY protein|nr:GxxExxY protein [Tannerella sp.]